MDQFLKKVVRPYWLALFVMAVGLLSLYTSSPIYGAPAATPTPDVQTVPKPIIIDTPTNTPFPTPTPEGNTNSPGGGGPVATRSPDNNQGNDDNNNNDNNDNNNSNNNQPNTPAPTTPATGGGAATTPVANSAPGNGSQSTGTTAGLTGVVNVVTLNLRKGPSTSEHIIDTLFMNDQVQVTGRDRAGAWWYVCCGAGSSRAGWVSAQFITPNFASTEAATLLPVLGNSPAAVATQSNKTTPQATGTPPVIGTPTAATADNTAATPLVMTMRAQPAFAWQGQRIQLQLALRNSGDQALTTIHLRNDLPPELAFVEATISNGGTYNYQGDANRGPLLAIDWPTLPAGAQVTAILTLQIRADTPIGALIDNLAAVTSAEGAETLAGLTLAMPPTGLPQFR